MSCARTVSGFPGTVRVFFILGFSATFLFWGCSQPPRADLLIVNGKEPESLDPGIVVGQPDGRVVMAIFEGLTRYNPETANPDPGLAERWEISPDGKTYTFHIRTNA